MEEMKVAEEVWEPPVEIENAETVPEEQNVAKKSTESVYWFIPQASDELLSEEEKEQLQSKVLSAAESVKAFYFNKTETFCCFKNQLSVCYS